MKKQLLLVALLSAGVSGLNAKDLEGALKYFVNIYKSARDGHSNEKQVQDDIKDLKEDMQGEYDVTPEELKKAVIKNSKNQSIEDSRADAFSEVGTMKGFYRTHFGS